MNKAFKVLWNHLRGSYVVASEATASHGKASKAVKTAVAVAAMAAMVGGAQAVTINNDSFGSGEDQYSSTKFVSGNPQSGESVVVQTNGDAKALLLAIKSGNSEAIRQALGTGNGVTLVGFAGGQNYVGDNTALMLNFAYHLSTIPPEQGKEPNIPESLKPILDKWHEWTTGENPMISSMPKDSLVVSESLTLNIGGLDHQNQVTNPLMVGSVAGDRLINTTASDTGTFTREGDIEVIAESGNLASFVVANSAITISGVSIGAGSLPIPLDAKLTETTLRGSTKTTLNGTTTTLGLFGAGSAIAMGSEGGSQSTVTGGTTITINTNTNSVGYEGISAGVIGGGLAAATMGGTSTATVQGDTKIDLQKGVLVGALGGGVAVSGEISPVTDKLFAEGGALAGYADNISFDESVDMGGTATASVKDVEVNVSSNASAFGIVGGGLAASQSMFDSKESSSATSNAGIVDINIGEAGSDPTFADNDAKGAFFTKLQGVLGNLQDYVADSESIGEFELVKNTVDALNQPGVTVGVLGGGMALAYQANNGATTPITTTSTAETIVDTVNIKVLSGYNVGIFGSGFAAASAASVGDDTLNATSTVTTSNITLSGGETIGVMGGGIGIFAGSAEPNTGIGAETTTGTSNITVNGTASVDGIVGGGLAIDDTNPKDEAGDWVTTKNVNSTVTTSNIKIEGSAVVEKLGFGYFFADDHVNNSPNETAAEKPGWRDHIDAMTYAMDNRNAAIVGGGLASGIRTETDEQGIAHVGTVDITIGENATIGSDERTGNVFGGGIATNGALSSVGTVKITVQDNATIKGSIYAGGIAQDGNYVGDLPHYEQSLATVETAEINLYGGTIEGNVYAGGLVSSATLAVEGASSSEGVSTSTVDQATIRLASGVTFEGEVIDGSGADSAAFETYGDYEFDAEQQKVKGFNSISSQGKVTGVVYDFGDRTTTTVTGNTVEFSSLLNTEGKTLAVGTDSEAGVVAVNPSGTPIKELTLKVDNGFLALNSDAETAQTAIASAPAQAQVAAYVTGSVDLINNKLLVGTATSEANGLYVGSNGLLVANAAGNTSVSGTTMFDEGSSIHFVNVADGQTVTIGSEGQEAAVGTTVDNVLYTVTQDGYSYTFAQRTSEQLDEVGLGDIDLQFLDGLDGQDNPGADYISGFLNEANSGVTNSNREQQVKAAMNLATAAGVQTMAIDGTMMGIEAANKRASIINNFVDGGKLFAELTGKHSEMGGGSGFGEIESDLGGLVVGGEYTTNDWTFGALANLGTGSVDGKGNNANVENDVDYYGIQAYAGKRFGQFNLVGQVGYLMSENDISHSTIGSNTADVDADVWTIGLRGEMRFELSDTARMVPYVGINYLRISTDGYTTSQGVKVDDVDQDLWTTPVGVKFAGDFESNSGWVWSPSLDVAYIPAFGDTDVDAKTDVGVVGHTSMDVWSDSVGRAKLGISAQKDNFGIGLEVGGAAGADDFTEYFGQVRVDYRF